METLPKLFSKDAKGNVREWWIEIDGAAYRSLSCVAGGKANETGWVLATPKNIGKVNATTAEQQAKLEVEAEYEKKLKEKYAKSVEEIDTAESSFVSPMLAHKFEEKRIPKNLGSVFMQPKLDGIRAVFKNGQLTSRNGRQIISAPHITEYLNAVHPDWVFDGELYNHDLKEDFNKIASLVKKTKPTEEDLLESRNMIQYHIYDVVDSVDFFNRYKLLGSIRGNESIRIVPTETVAIDDISDRTSKWIEDGYEGGMVRLPHGKYEHKRSFNLMKVKEFVDEEFTVLDIQEGLGSWAGKAKKVILREDSTGIEFEAGMRGNFEFATKVLHTKAEFIGKPATVRYQNRTPDENKPRFGVVVHFWADGVKE